MAKIETEICGAGSAMRANGNGTVAATDTQRRERGTAQLPVVYRASADPMLTDDVREVLEGFLKALADQAQRQGVPVTRLEVYGTPDSDEATGRVVVVQWVDLSPDEAMAHWDEAGDAIERWTAGLLPKQQEIALNLIALSVEWNDNAAAV